MNYSEGYKAGYQDALNDFKAIVGDLNKLVDNLSVKEKKKPLEERKKLFRIKVMTYTKFSEQMLEDFFVYWSEENKSKTKMRFEREKTFQISARLRTWERNNKKFNKSNVYNQLTDEGILKF